MKNILTLIALQLISSACVSTAGYRPLVAHVPSGADVIGALRQLALESQWSVVDGGADGANFEALGPDQWMSGALTRERWRFTVVEDTVFIERRLEVKFDTESEWAHADGVCDTYMYLAENAQRARLVTQLQNTISPLVAAARELAAEGPRILDLVP